MKDTRTLDTILELWTWLLPVPRQKIPMIDVAHTWKKDVLRMILGESTMISKSDAIFAYFQLFWMRNTLESYNTSHQVRAMVMHTWVPASSYLRTPGESSDPTTPGQPSTNNLYQMILNSQDRAFHFELYEWFINKGMIKQLLTVRITMT